MQKSCRNKERIRPFITYSWNPKKIWFKKLRGLNLYKSINTFFIIVILKIMKTFKSKKEAISFLAQNGANKKHIQDVINYGVTKWNEKIIIVDENELL